MCYYSRQKKEKEENWQEQKNASFYPFNFNARIYSANP